MAEGGHTLRFSAWRTRVRWVVAAVFLLAASLHFTATESEIRLVPRWLPWQRALVYASGVAEIAGAIALLVPRTRRISAWGLIALLVAVFPANLNHAVADIHLGTFMDSRLYQWGRLPLQPLFIAIVYWCAAYPGRD